MTVKELKAKLEGVPDTMEVYINQTDDEFAFAYAENAKVQEVQFSEDGHGGGETAMDNVFVITDSI